MKTGATSKDWIGVDRRGLAALLERRGVGWAIYELVQNALDTEATEVVVTLEEIPRSPRVRVTVEDNDPTGFHDLRHAFTMFAPSIRAGDAERRGRSVKQLKLGWKRDAKLSGATSAALCRRCRKLVMTALAQEDA